MDGHHRPNNLFKELGLIREIIIVRFMVDQHPFLFEALARVDNITFPF
jgi:hypothetical protein